MKSPEDSEIIRLEGENEELKNLLTLALPSVEESELYNKAVRRSLSNQIREAIK